MNSEINSANPAVKAIISGAAPRPAQVAAARGILPLPIGDLLEVLVALARADDAELAGNARATIASQDASQLLNVLKTDTIAPQVLSFFAAREKMPREIHEAILTNPKTPPEAIASFASTTQNGELLEYISLNQQLLIRTPAIIEAIVNNPHRTAEAERRASEVKREFFEKERGAQQIANELRARGQEAAAEFMENSESELSLEDALFLARHIEVPDSETDDSWLLLEHIEEFYEETGERREAVIGKILGDLRIEEDGVSNDRISMINRIMRMKMKDRVLMAMKGDREARNVLIRDPNRIVAQAVVQNPRITEQEIEKIAAMRTAPEEVLRQICVNRNFARNYTIIHNLARNPRTPFANAVSILSRLQVSDLTAISKNRNVSDAVRRQAGRLVAARTGR
ncbi:MAG: hypothetical protein JWN60_1449 [Acidobacteria bacterium]|jgi:hypothetical protein|nr:hypothetical protein [Acidobacteriota bacterium]